MTGPTGVQYARIAEVLTAHPEGLSTVQIAELCGFDGRPRKRALTRYGGFLRRMEWGGKVTRCGKVPAEYHNIPVIVWRLADNTAPEPAHCAPAEKVLSAEPSLASLAYRRDVSFGAVGSVSVIVNVRWLDLPEEKFIKLRNLIKAIEALPAGAEP